MAYFCAALIEWNYLGHAGWLCVANGLRILCDPLLEPTHHGGVFEVAPRRTIHAPALRPDFIVITHAHTDHFDIPSLRRLAQMDPDTVVFTSDAIVEFAAKKLGFATVHRAATDERIALDQVELLTTRSYADSVEWGLIVTCNGLTTWNQVDTVHRSPDDVVETLARAARGLTLPSLTDHVDLLLARWQPLCEIAPMLGHRSTFAYQDYARLLEEVAATHARWVVPASAGGRHVAPFEWLNHFSHPLPMSRFLRDISLRMPEVKALPAHAGARYILSPQGVHFEPRGAAQLVQLDPHAQPTPPPDEWRPVEVPAVQDHNPLNYPEPHARQVVQQWVHQSLLPALHARFGSLHKTGPVRLVLQAVFGSSTDSYTVDFSTPTTTVVHEYDAHWDALNVISGSSLCAVIESRACWGDVLLSGNLRAFSRLYTVDTQGLKPTPFGVTFLYYALSYQDSFERYVRYQLEHLD